MDAIECMRTRRSVRQYKDTPIAREVVEEIIDCGRLAASAINIQPWKFFVVTNAELRKRLAEATDHGKFIADAPVCVVVCSENVKYFLEDGSAATQNILNAARAHGLGSCWVAGDKKEYGPAICKLVGAPEGYRLISLVAIGEAASVPSPGKKALGEALSWIE